MQQDDNRSKAQLLNEVEQLRRRVDELERRHGEQAQVAEALRTSEALFRAIHEHAPLMIDAFDENGRCVLWNRECERIFGWTMEEVNFHEDPLSVFYPDRRIREDVMKSVTAMPTETFREWRPLGKDGKERITLWANFLLPDGTVINLGQDISERKRQEEERLELERQVQHAQKLESLGIMAGGIAHDFNNLLNVILGGADLALRDLTEASPVRPLILQVEKAARSAEELTRQMLAYSGRGRFEVRKLDLSELAEDMAHLIKSSISKKVEMEMDLPTPLPAVKGDGAQVQQIIMNLITNAAEAVADAERSPVRRRVPSGTVKVSTGTMYCSSQYLNRSRLPERPDEGEFVYIEVADSDCGMNEEVKEKLFDPFFTTKFTGRGLGMSSVLGIVRGHRGAIMVDSEPGEGTSVRALFPALHEPAESTFGRSVGREPVGWAGQGTILVVDDEQSVRQMAKRMLEQMGFDVRTACDGREAVEVFREHSDEIVAVLLDLSMPHMDGEQAACELRREDADVRVILSSGYAERELKVRFADRGGISAFIQKPYQSEALRERLRSVLGA